MDISRSDDVYNRRYTRSFSYIMANLVSVIIYLVNLVVSGLFFGVFVFVYTKTDTFRTDHGKCFLFSNISESTSLCSSSIAILGFLWISNVVLIVLGIASIVRGRRTPCPKALEIIIVGICFVVGMFVSMIISVGMNYKDLYICQDEVTCGKYEYYIYASSWLMVVLFFLALMVNFVDCIFHLPTRNNRNHNIRYSNDHWFDERVLLRSTKTEHYS